jgi:RNA polymerase primary sigma factor
MRSNEELALDYQSPNPKTRKAAGEALIKQNEGMIWKEVNKCTTSPACDEEDMFQQGAMGLLRAAELFRPVNDRKFSTYAYFWILQGVRRYQDNNANTIRIPIHAKKHATNPTVTRSLDEVINGDKGNSRRPTTLGETIPDKPKKQDLGEISPFVQKLLHLLHPKHRRVIELRFGLDIGKKRTLEDTSLIMGFSRQRVQQIEKASLEKIRDYARQECIESPL